MTESSRGPVALTLVADLGGTKARFGVVDGEGVLRHRAELRSDDFPGPAEAAESFLAGPAGVERPRRGVFAVAAPVTGDRIALTNRSWDFSVEATRRTLGLDEFEAINDFVALALSLPGLGGDDLRRVKPGRRVKGAPMALVGPGTGLGVAGLVPVAGAWWPVAAEGGHRDLAVSGEREWRVFEALRRNAGRRHGGQVSCERVLSGPGLVNLTAAIRDVGGGPGEDSTPESVVRRAGEDRESAEAEAVRLFSSWLGAMAGDLALTLGARGGLFLGGGILPRMGRLFDAELFNRRFVAKGRLLEYLEPIPVDLILHSTAALLGAARYLELDHRESEDDDPVV